MDFLHVCVLLSILHLGFAVSSIEDEDLIPLGFNNDVLEAFDENPENSDQQSVDLSTICKNSNDVVYLKHEDLVFDCKIYNEHRIEKRDAELEGSGTGDEITKEDAAPIESQDQNNEDGVNVTINKENDLGNPAENKTEENIAATIVETGSETIPKVTESEDSTKGDTNVPQIANVSQPDDETVTNPEENVTTVDVVKTPNENEPTVADVEKPEVTVPKIDIENTEHVHQDTKEDETVDVNTENNNGKFVAKETIDNSQKSRTLGGKNPSEDTKTGESTDNTTKSGSKDTTILIFLFVAVVVVGVAAFAYNFIKKRRSQSPDLERGAANVTKRNGTTMNNADSEPEQKPLITGKKEVEMVDMKNNLESPKAAH